MFKPTPLDLFLANKEYPKLAKWYQEYLNSPKWQTIRDKMHNKYVKCRCGSSEHLIVHHKTYERVGHERLRDLELLCGLCHRLAHHRRIIPYSERIYDESFKMEK